MTRLSGGKDVEKPVCRDNIAIPQFVTLLLVGKMFWRLWYCQQYLQQNRIDAGVTEPWTGWKGLLFIFPFYPSVDWRMS